MKSRASWTNGTWATQAEYKDLKVTRDGETLWSADLGGFTPYSSLDARTKERLEPIRGLPPDLIDLPDMCPFVPRCNYAREQCEQKNPPLMEVSPGHFSACWFWEEVSLADEFPAASAATEGA